MVTQKSSFAPQNCKLEEQWLTLVYIFSRAEPLLARIKADRTVVVSPVFDKVHFDDLHVEKYYAFAHGFDWALWCIYESFAPAWYKKQDESQPGKYVTFLFVHPLKKCT